MVMGPQILTAIFLVTSKEPVKNSVAMLVGVLVAASLSVLIWFGLYDVSRHQVRPSGSGPSTADYVVAGLLALPPERVAASTRRRASIAAWIIILPSRATAWRRSR